MRSHNRAVRQISIQQRILYHRDLTIDQITLPISADIHKLSPQARDVILSKAMQHLSLGQ